MESREISKERQLRNFHKKIDFLIPFVIIAIVWEILVEFSILNEKLFPPPSKIANTFIDLLINRSPSLIDHIQMSLFHIVFGYLLGVSLGIFVGIMMGINRNFYNAIYPIMSLLIPVPTLAWVPVLLIVFGLGHETIIIAIFLGCFFPISYNTLNGIRSADPHLIWAAQIMGADKKDIYRQVLLPSSLLSSITGLRLAVGYSWRALVGAEMLAGIQLGIGKMIYTARWGFNLDVMFTGLIIIALGGLLMDRIILRPLEIKTVKKWGMVKER